MPTLSGQQERPAKKIGRARGYRSGRQPGHSGTRPRALRRGTDPRRSRRARLPAGGHSPGLADVFLDAGQQAQAIIERPVEIGAHQRRRFARSGRGGNRSVQLAADRAKVFHFPAQDGQLVGDHGQRTADFGSHFRRQPAR